jgi:hypothetical protein
MLISSLYMPCHCANPSATHSFQADYDVVDKDGSEGVGSQAPVDESFAGFGDESEVKVPASSPYSCTTAHILHLCRTRPFVSTHPNHHR